MASHNVWTFSGNLGSDPELRQVGDRQVCNFSVAVNGRRDEPTTWVRVAAWGPQAEQCARFLAKGRQVIVTGSARLREYEGKSGKGVSLEVDAAPYGVTFIGGRDDAQADGGQPQGQGGWGGGSQQGRGNGSGGGWGGGGGGSQSSSGGWGGGGDDPIPF